MCVRCRMGFAEQCVLDVEWALLNSVLDVECGLGFAEQCVKCRMRAGPC